MSGPRAKGGGKGGSTDFGADDDGRAPAKAPTRTSTGQIPVQTGGASGKGARGLAPAAEAAPTGPRPALPAGQAYVDNPFNLTSHQKQSMQSGFQDAVSERKVASMLGGGAAKAARASEATAAPAAGSAFDGEEAPAELQGRDVWKAVQPPLTSAPGRRSAALTEQVINQFAVATNPRYQPDAGEKPRGHIYVWDVTRAMGCEIPHFTGPRELTLAQTCDWLRHEGPMRGWTRVAEHDVFEALATGQAVVAMPKDLKTKYLAVVPPQEPTADGKPKVNGACRKRGQQLHVSELFGVRLIEYFMHA